MISKSRRSGFSLKMFLTLFLTTLLMAPGLGALAQATDLFFSEYVEGSSNNKALEIYNGTGAVANLSEYVVEVYNNGAATPNNSLTLSDAVATLADGDVLVIANASADAAILAVSDITSSVTFFNGDDALALRRNGVIIDVIGVIGSDPGTQWGGGAVTTKEHSIRRLAAVCEGDSDGFDNPSDLTNEWEGFAQNTFDGLGAHSADCVSAFADDLLFSEYVEGSSNNKALEIYNGTGAAADLSEYVVQLYSNGSATPGNTLTLSSAAASLADGDALVIANASADPAILAVADITSSVTFFNGDDALALVRNGVIIDVIGVIGSDPGTQWGGGAVTTKEHSIRRLASVCTGDPDGFDNPSDITDQWEGFPQNTFDGLGVHTQSCGTPPNASVVVDCGASLDLNEGDGGTRQVTAGDADGTIVGIDVLSVVPLPAAGTISAGAFMPAAGMNPATVVVTVSTSVPAGSYQVTMEAVNDDVTPQTGTCSFSVNVVGPPASGWVINEILADPAAGLAGDANGDGVRDFSDDEFVELVNVSGSAQNIGNWTLSDGFGTRHVFPVGTVIADNEAIVVFGGPTITGTFGGATVQTASSGALGLNNGGDTVTLASDSAAVQAQVTYGSEGGNNQSLTLDPDLTGAAYVLHGGAAGSGGALFSPGTQIDGTAFSGPTGADDLFFSEYVEGSSNNKALEIFNGTGSAADLSEYVVEIYNNGAATPNNSLTLSDAAATLADGDVLVIANPSADPAILAIADITSSVTFFNGDDALALRRNGTIIDVIGVIGSDPGSFWGGAAVTTRNDTIRRLPSVCAGDPDGFDNPLDISDQWEGFPQNTFDGLGSHGAICGSVFNAPVVVDCNGPLNLGEGKGGGHLVTAEDADGTIVGISITNISPMPAAGTISAGAFTPASGSTPASALITVSVAVPVGTYVVEVSAVNDDASAQSGSCDLTINVVPVLPIHEIQGPGLASPIANQVVSTSGNVVTAVDVDGFYIQTPDTDVDADPMTSEGLLIFTGGVPTVSVGDVVDATGQIVEFFGLTEMTNNPAYSVTGSGQPQPLSVSLGSTLPDPNSPPQSGSLEPLEGMLVELSGGIASGPSNQFGDAHITATPNRAFREPGILFPGLMGLPVWDGNPELFELDPDALGLPDVEIDAGDQIASAAGPLGFVFGDYQLQPTSLTVVPAGIYPIVVRNRDPGEFTIGSQNMFRLFKDQPSGSGYADRLNKFSLQIRVVLGAPDILAIQEVGNIQVLQDLADKIVFDDATINYTPYLIEGNDVGGIDVGFLVRSSVQVLSVMQIQPTEPFTFNGATSPLHDRPPLLLEANYVGGVQPFPISVIAIHNRSLSGIADADGRVRLKRFEQADKIATAIQDLQTADPDIRLVVTGDFNAFQFTDGYVDSLGQITGNLDPLGALLPGIDRVNPDLENQVLGLPFPERYSFNFNGNSQVLDHSLTSAALAPFVVEVQYGRGNSDVARSKASDPDTPLRSSDHDGLVLFLLRDEDGDGVIDDDDQCPASDLSATVVIDGCDSGVPNLLFPDGCTISDLIAQCAAGAKNHGKFVSCVSHLGNDLKMDGLITGAQKGALTSCAAQSSLP